MHKRLPASDIEKPRVKFVARPGSCRIPGGLEIDLIQQLKIRLGRFGMFYDVLMLAGKHHANLTKMREHLENISRTQDRAISRSIQVVRGQTENFFHRLKALSRARL